MDLRQKDYCLSQKKINKKINDEMPMSKQVHYQGYNY